MKNAYVTSVDLAHIDAMEVESSMFNSRYREHPHIKEDFLKDIFKLHIKNIINSRGKAYSLTHGDNLEAILTLKPLLWDTKHFEQNMARLEIHCKKTMSAPISLALNKVLSEAAKGTHISTDIDLDNYLLLNTLTNNYAFEVMDIKREFRWLSLSRVTKPKFISKVELYSDYLKDDVLNLLKKINFETRFTNDCAICQKKTKSMYSIWVNNLLNDIDSISVIYKKKNKVVAFGAISRTTLESSTKNMDIYDKGIYFASKEGIGAYYPIIYKLAELALQRASSVQTSVSIHNYDATRVLERLNGTTNINKVALRKIL